jgi:hypothetical protein
LLTLGVALFSGCGILADECTLEFRYGVVLSVADSTTGLPVIADSVSVTATDGEYLEQLRLSSEWAFRGGAGLAGERAGTYGVVVSADGYRSWATAGVVVDEDKCHVHTVSMTARLQRR